MIRRNFIKSIFGAALLPSLIKEPSFVAGGLIHGSNAKYLMTSTSNKYILPYNLTLEQSLNNLKKTVIQETTLYKKT